LLQGRGTEEDGRRRAENGDVWGRLMREAKARKGL